MFRASFGSAASLRVIPDIGEIQPLAVAAGIPALAEMTSPLERSDSSSVHLHAEHSDPIRLPQQADRTLGARIIAEPVRDMAAGHRAVAREMRRCDLAHARFDRLCNLARERVGVLLDAVR